MDAQRWERVQALFHEAAALPRVQQRTWLEARCTDDASLIDEVLGMLEADARDVNLGPTAR